MALIFEGSGKEKKGKTRLFVYMKKELEIQTSEDLDKLKDLLAKAREFDLYDEVFISEKEDLEEILSFKKYYEALAIKEVKSLRQELLRITKIIKGILERLNLLEEKLEK